MTLRTRRTTYAHHPTRDFGADLLRRHYKHLAHHAGRRKAPASGALTRSLRDVTIVSAPLPAELDAPKCRRFRGAARAPTDGSIV